VRRAVPPGVIEALVTDAQSGRPLLDAKITLEGTAILDSNPTCPGVFRFTAVPPGVFNLHVQARGHQSQIVRGLRAKTGGGLLVPVALPFGSGLKGYVRLCASGPPFANATIAFTNRTARVEVPLAAERGFEVVGLRPGERHQALVRIRGPEGKSYFITPWERPVIPPLDSFPALLEIDVVPAAVLAIVVAEVPSSPAVLEVLTEDGRIQWRGELSRGRLLKFPLPPAIYRLRLTLPGTPPKETRLPLPGGVITRATVPF
jgi:hypothetical protein